MSGWQRARRGRRRPAGNPMSKVSVAKFGIGQITRHRVHAFRGVVFDVDPEFADSDVSYETVQLIEGRQRKDQPFYYLFAENDQTPYIAYVSEQNLLADNSGEPVSHPQLDDMFERDERGGYRWRTARAN
jgi:heat shock protein HspQ